MGERAKVSQADLSFGIEWESAAFTTISSKWFVSPNVSTLSYHRMQATTLTLLSITPKKELSFLTKISLVSIFD